MYCKCGSSKNVKQRFKDKDFVCEDCYQSAKAVIKEDRWLDLERGRTKEAPKDERLY